MNSIGFNEISQEELLAIDGGGFWSEVAYYAFAGGMGALGGAVGTAIGGPIGGAVGARVGFVVGGMAGAWAGDQIWDATH